MATMRAALALAVPLTFFLASARAQLRAERRTETVDGGRASMPLVLHIHPGATIAHVLTSLDAAAAAGVELRTPGLRGLSGTRDR